MTPAIYLLVYLSPSVCLSFCLCMDLPACLLACLPAYLSISTSLCLHAGFLRVPEVLCHALSSIPLRIFALVLKPQLGVEDLL